MMNNGFYNGDYSGFNGYNEQPRVAHSPEYVRQNKPKKKKKGQGGKMIALAVCFSLVGGAAGAGSYALCSNLIEKDAAIEEKAENETTMLLGQREATALNTASVDTEQEMSQSEVYAANVNSTVGIRTSVTTNYFGYQTQAAAAGSGFILTEDGYIVTNQHVIEGAESIKVTTYDNTEYDAELVGYDETNDLAILKIDADGLKPVVIGDSDKMNVGDSVIAIGNPLGELTFSLTSGSISALNRDVTIENRAMTLIQTDCAINSGNSGGALFNSHGEVIGITNAKFSGNGTSASVDNIGFAIPINSVRDLIDDIIEKGYTNKPYIGITGSDLGSEYQMQGIGGVVVTSVVSDGPAAKAGIQVNDIITKVNGKEITGMAGLKSILGNMEEGDIVKLTVYRQGETKEVDVTVGIHAQSTLPDNDSTGK